MYHNPPLKIEAQRIPDIVLKISQRLMDRGFQAFIVGGAVRDAVRGYSPKDWDIATDATPPEIHELFSDMTQYSLKHGTVTLVIRRKDIEVTTFRCGGGFGVSIDEDLAHRDFTINAMAYDQAHQNIIDPFDGRQDIARKLVRAVRDPADRFREDPLRMMRAIRFSVQLGYGIDPDTLVAIGVMAQDINGVSRERIRDELLAILMARKPSAGFAQMRKTGLLRRLLPELCEGYRKPQNDYHKYTILRHIMETVDSVERDPVLRLSALFHDIAKPRVREKVNRRWRFLGHAAASAELAGDIMFRLRFSNEWIDHVTALVTHHMFDYKQQLTDRALRRFIKRVGPDTVSDLIKLRKADDLAHGWGRGFEKDIDGFGERIRAIQEQSPPLTAAALAVNGHDVMEVLGVQPGPAVGRVLNRLLEMVIEKPEQNRKERLIEAVKDMRGK